MRRSILLTAWLLLLIACGSPKHLIKNEKYDLAVEKLSRKLRTGKERSQDVLMLKEAYHAANQIDHDRIQLLRKSGKPEIWPEVYILYKTMDIRQQKLRFLSDYVKQTIGFQLIQYDEYILEAQNHAVDYLTASIKQKLQSQSKSDARQALILLNELETIYPDYSELDQLKRQAIMQAVNYVLIQFDNQSKLSVPDEFVQTIMNFSEKDFKETLVSYDLSAQPGLTYDYLIYITLKDIIVSPERIDTRQFTEKREIVDGTKPKRDTNGNIMIDSAGQVIEVPNYKQIQAIVKETSMRKNVLIRVSIDYEDNHRHKLIHSIALERPVSFIHNFAKVDGDIRACSKATLELIKHEAIPFPADGAMVADAAHQLHEEIKRVLRKEAGIVKQANDR